MNTISSYPNPNNFFDYFEFPFRTRRMNADLIEKDDSFLLKCSLPGFEKDEITVTADRERLTICANRSESGSDSYVRHESSSSFCRSFDLSGIQCDKISAAYKNGILELTLPKDESRPCGSSRKIQIQ